MFYYILSYVIKGFKMLMGKSIQPFLGLEFTIEHLKHLAL